MDNTLHVSRYLHLKGISHFKIFNLFLRGFENSASLNNYNYSIKPEPKSNWDWKQGHKASV